LDSKENEYYVKRKFRLRVYWWSWTDAR